MRGEIAPMIAEVYPQFAMKVWGYGPDEERQAANAD